MLEAIVRLRRLGWLNAMRASRLLEAVATTGINLMSLLRIAARSHSDHIAVIDDNERLSYRTIWQHTEALAAALHDDYGIRSRQTVAIACRNHAAAVKAMFALSRLGANVVLLNPDLSEAQFRAVEKRIRFDFHIYDEHLEPLFKHHHSQRKSLPAYHPSQISIDCLSSRPGAAIVRAHRWMPASIVVMTGGTTGRMKPASRKPSIFDFLPPFTALLEQAQLDSCRSVYIATPVYHGFGLASLIVSILLGAEIHLAARFDAARACSLIAENSVEVVTLVPLMLRRMLDHDPIALRSLRRIIAGGAPLSPVLVRNTNSRLGEVLFNLYGTSEAGFCIMATPNLLHRKPESIGKPIRGVQARIVNEVGERVSKGSVGRLLVRSTWTTSRREWIETGDLAYQDAEEDLFLCGRIDDMIVSGGECVYPIELENVLLQHPDVDSAAVVGIADREFGERLKAVVVRRGEGTLDQEMLRDWLRPRVARHQMPAAIEFRDRLPYTDLGKVDRKALRG